MKPLVRLLLIIFCILALPSICILAVLSPITWILFNKGFDPITEYVLGNPLDKMLKYLNK